MGSIFFGLKTGFFRASCFGFRVKGVCLLLLPLVFLINTLPLWENLINFLFTNYRETINLGRRPAPTAKRSVPLKKWQAAVWPKKIVQGVRALWGFWNLKKIKLQKICISGTVSKTQLIAKNSAKHHHLLRNHSCRKTVGSDCIKKCPSQHYFWVIRWLKQVQKQHSSSVTNSYSKATNCLRVNSVCSTTWYVM